ncbi:glycosyltransferase family 4 protein [Schnuerera ultunensis]|jgi:glycosyltransferase involved in cell wall biosynthesis|uniref:Putative glycosyl transferase n=1 Tax=[Clostridium] ultunense Esp TaxID=1288971 RepID=A0A1M4PS67_9FIRM|nr:glycosyltransferase family 4 protein [Schnuerera ultunensis]SHD78359.1 putative glycosyl transferase [[Clostridium] ultunense Esp]
MKKILHIISQYPGKTGSGTYLNQLIIEGNKKGYTQGLVAALYETERNIQLEISEENFYPVMFNTTKIPFPIVGMSDTMPYNTINYSDMSNEMLTKWKEGFKEAVLRAVDEFKPDVIITHHLWILTSLIRMVIKDIRVIAICHGTDIRQFQKNPRYRHYVVKGCKEIDLVLSLNQEQGKIINNLYSIPKDKIITIGGGFDEEKFYPPDNKLPGHVVKLIYAGKLSYAKGVMSLIRAYNMLNMKEDEIELSIAGAGIGFEEKTIKEAGYNSRLKVNFLGELSQKKLGKVFRNSHIFIMPSFYEGLSLVTIEALATGLMVVASSIGGLKSFLGDKINNSGIIEYVELPKLDNVDLPLKDEIPLYEERLKKAIEKQIYRLKEGYIWNDNVKNRISQLSWINIYNRIEEYF